MEPEVLKKFESYPENIRSRMLALRQTLLDVVEDLSVGPVQETLKWGEPSYAVKGGSPIRMDWKTKKPDQVALYFVCTTKLVDTFRELYGNSLQFEGNRAIVFGLSDRFPMTEVKHCIALALQYQKVKHLPLLGA